MAPKNTLYQPQLEGRALFEAAAQVGQIHGESAFAQCMYCRDIQEQELHFQFGYACLHDFTR